MQKVSLNPRVETAPTSVHVNTLSDNLRVFWMPGCSSCVKVKEHLKRLGIAFESVNVLEQPEAREELAARGIRGAPIVSRGNRFVYAQSLEIVNEFLNITEELPKRETEFLFKKWISLLNTGIGYLETCPPEELRANVLPGRDRPVGELAYHAFQIVDAFLHCMKSGEREWLDRASGAVKMDVALSKPLLLDFARKTTTELERYWNDGATEYKDVDASDRPFEGDLRTTHEFLDRSSWHSAQHLRQVATVLTRDGVALVPAWGDDMVKGLGVPNALWQ